MKQYICFIFAILILTSCRTQVVEYPQIFFSGQSIQKEKEIKIPEYELNDDCDNGLKHLLYSIVDSSSSDCFIARLSQFKDTIQINFNDIELSSALKPLSNIVGVIVVNKKSKSPKYIFLTPNITIEHLINKTNKIYKFKPLLIRLAKDRYIGYYDRTTHLDGYILSDHLFINHFILDNKKNDRILINHIWNGIISYTSDN